MSTWLKTERVLSAMIGVNGGATSRAAFDFAVSLRNVGPVNLILTQTAWPMGEYYRYGVAPPFPIDRLRPELETLLVRDLEAWAGDIAGEGSLRFSVRPGLGRVERPGGVVHLTYVRDPSALETADTDKARLAQLIPVEARSRGVHTELEIVEDDEASLGICRTAKRRSVDAICMATHARGGISRLVLGSVAADVIGRAEHVVVLVPPPSASSARTLECLQGGTPALLARRMHDPASGGY